MQESRTLLKILGPQATYGPLMCPRPIWTPLCASCTPYKLFIMYSWSIPGTRSASVEVFIDHPENWEHTNRYIHTEYRHTWVVKHNFEPTSLSNQFKLFIKHNFTVKNKSLKINCNMLVGVASWLSYLLTYKCAIQSNAMTIKYIQEY